MKVMSALRNIRLGILILSLVFFILFEVYIIHIVEWSKLQELPTGGISVLVFTILNTVFSLWYIFVVFRKVYKALRHPLYEEIEEVNEEWNDKPKIKL